MLVELQNRLQMWNHWRLRGFLFWCLSFWISKFQQKQLTEKNLKRSHITINFNNFCLCGKFWLFTVFFSFCSVMGSKRLFYGLFRRFYGTLGSFCKVFLLNVLEVVTSFQQKKSVLLNSIIDPINKQNDGLSWIEGASRQPFKVKDECPNFLLKIKNISLFSQAIFWIGSFKEERLFEKLRLKISFFKKTCSEKFFFMSFF